MVNGVTVTQERVDTLFQSVHLSVNNPHFLIMQGRITKILSMKPQEISSMLEETAGTRMYKDRKDKALATINKKQLKVQEITQVGPQIYTTCCVSPLRITPNILHLHMESYTIVPHT